MELHYAVVIKDIESNEKVFVFVNNLTTENLI